ncbi:MAG: hypothetical protein IJQ10_02070 [Clostridia bacterium]|nr:hypothetical protein [Clostridia bacterium]
MKKFGKDKVALFLTCMSVFGNRTSAMNANKAQNPQPVVAVGGATSRNNRSVKQGLSKNQKLAIGGTVSLAVVSAVGFTIWGVTRNKNKSGSPSDGEQNGEQAKIAQQNLEIIHKKFDDFYTEDKTASDKAKKVFDSVKSQINKNINEYANENQAKALDYFADVINGKIELNDKNINNIMIVKPRGTDDFALDICDENGNRIAFGYDSKEKVFNY